MKDKIKLYYARISNMGDLLNVLIMEELFGLEVERHSVLTGEFSAIGSGLDNFTLHGSAAMRLQQRLYGIIHPDVKVWGTGFINYNENDPPFFRRMNFLAIRGELSRRRAEKLLKKPLDIPTGDAGLLARDLIELPKEKTHPLGIVPHVCDLSEPAVMALRAQFPEAVLIDVRDDPWEVLSQIASCEAILSSSLHGLIAADSFNIPNHHVVFSDKPLGDGFKFDDYYSAYGLAHDVTDLREKSVDSIDEIKSRYAITPEMVEKKRRELFRVFPYPPVKK